MRTVAAPLSALLLTLCASATSGQQPPRQPGPLAPRGTDADGGRAVDASLFGLMYTGFGRVADGATGSSWVLADVALGAGAGVSMQIGTNFDLGLEGTAARTPYERRVRTGNAVLASGDATVATFLATARLQQAGFRIPGVPGFPGMGGGGAGVPGFATYLVGGLGTVVYWLDDLEEGNPDFAFSAGGGVQYVWEGGTAGFLELKQLWSLHEREGVENAMARHSRVELGVRMAPRP